jgi:hypothetical protein
MNVRKCFAILFSLLFSSIVSAQTAQTTIVQGRNIISGSGGQASGTITIVPNVSFTAADGFYVDTTPIIATITAGSFDQALEPTPVGVWYNATWRITNRPSRLATWVVPARFPTIPLSNVEIPSSTAFPIPSLFNSLQIGDIFTVGAGGVVQYQIVDKDSSVPTRVVNAASGSCGIGVALDTASFSQPVTIQWGGQAVIVADNVVTAGHWIGGGTTIPGRGKDLGTGNLVSLSTCTIGFAKTSAVAGATFYLQMSGPPASAAFEPTVTPGTTSQYWRGDKTWQPLTSTAVTEGTNLYFTNARVLSAMAGLYEVPLTFGTGVVRTSNAIACVVGNGSTLGCLSAVDWTTFNAKQAALGFAPENAANKGAVSGYAALDGSIKVPIAQIPTGQTGGTVPFGNDARFTDSRVPTGSATGDLGGTYPTPTVQRIHQAVTVLSSASSPYTVLSTDSYLACNAAGGAITITLPLATATGRELTVKKTDSSANACTLTRASSDTIDGATTLALTAQNAAAKVLDRVSGVWDRTHVNQVGGDVSGPSTNQTVTRINGGAVPNSAAFLGTDSSGRPIAQPNVTDDGANINVTGRNVAMGTTVLPAGVPITATSQSGVHNDGTSATANTAAINTLLSGLAFGSRVYFPAGTYAVNDELLLANKNGVTIECAGTSGTIFQWAGSAAPGKALLRITNASFTRIKDCQFDGSASATNKPDYGVWITSRGAAVTQENVLSGVIIKRFLVANVRLGSVTNVDTNVDGNKIENSNLDGAAITQYGVIVGNSNTNLTAISNVTMASHTVAGVGVVLSARGVTIHKPYFAENGTAHVLIDNTISGYVHITDFVTELVTHPFLIAQPTSGGVSSTAAVVLEAGNLTCNFASATIKLIDYEQTGSLTLRNMQIAGIADGTPTYIYVVPPNVTAPGLRMLVTDNLHLHDGATFSVTQSGAAAMRWIGTYGYSATTTSAVTTMSAPSWQVTGGGTTATMALSTTDSLIYGGNARWQFLIPTGTNGLRIKADTQPFEFQNLSDTSNGFVVNGTADFSLSPKLASGSNTTQDSPLFTFTARHWTGSASASHQAQMYYKVTGPSTPFGGFYIKPTSSATGWFVQDVTGYAGNTTTPTSPLHITGLPVYANNAAALAGGLTAGAFYRTGADPDPVMVVH